MSDDNNRTLQHAATGIAVVLVISWLLRRWKLVLFLFLLAYFFYWMDGGPERDAAVAQFNHTQVKMQIEPLSSRLDDNIRATITNGGQARIYKTSARCEYRTEFREEYDPPFRIETFDTTAHYGYIKPGETVKVALTIRPSGFWTMGDYKTVECKPVFFVERSDMFQQVGKPELTLLSQAKIDLEYVVNPTKINSSDYRVMVRGVLENKAEKRIASISVDCYAPFSFHDFHHSTLIYVGAEPGETKPFAGTVLFKNWYHRKPPEAMFCHATGAKSYN